MRMKRKQTMGSGKLRRKDLMTVFLVRFHSSKESKAWPISKTFGSFGLVTTTFFFFSAIGEHETHDDRKSGRDGKEEKGVLMEEKMLITLAFARVVVEVAVRSA